MKFIQVDICAWVTCYNSAWYMINTSRVLPFFWLILFYCTIWGKNLLLTPDTEIAKTDHLSFSLFEKKKIDNLLCRVKDPFPLNQDVRRQFIVRSNQWISQDKIIISVSKLNRLHIWVLVFVVEMVFEILLHKNRIKYETLEHFLGTWFEN